MKRFILCAAVLLAVVLCLGTAAEEDMLYAEVELLAEGAFPELSYISTFALMDAEDSLVAGLEEQREIIDVSTFGMLLEEFTAFYVDALNRRPELFYVSSAYYYKKDDAGCVSAVKPVYLYSGEELDSRIRDFERSVSAIADYASNASTELGKLLLVNDYFCINFDYALDNPVYRPDLLFSGKKGVCQAYMLAYAAVLNELEIENTYAISEAMNHTWNLVRLDGDWYHIDVTWNDPVGAPLLYAAHDNFLLSDDGIAASGHYLWSAAAAAENEQYDSAFWAELNTPIPVIGDTVYYCDPVPDGGEYNIYAWDAERSSTSVFHTFSIAGSGGYSYSSGFVGLASYKDTLYYGAGSKLYSIETAGGLPLKVYELENANAQIYSAWRDGKQIMLCASEDLFDSELISIDVPEWVFEMDVYPGATVLEAEETLQLTAFEIHAPDSLLEASWSSSDQEIATVDADGLVTVVGVGAAEITASYDKYTASAFVVIHSDEITLLPGNLSVIGEEAFKLASAVEIVIPEGVEEIGDRTFANCENLKLITIPESVHTFGEDIFDGCTGTGVLCKEGSDAQAYFEEEPSVFCIIME